MSFSKPKIPAVSTPAARPERQVEVEAEDVELGDTDSQDGKKKGKRALMRPTGATATGGTTGTSGSGLAV